MKKHWPDISKCQNKVVGKQFSTFFRIRNLISIKKSHLSPKTLEKLSWNISVFGGAWVHDDKDVIR